MSEIRNLYFKRSNGEHILLAPNVTEREAIVEMQNFMHKNNFTSYYTRTWEEDGVKWYDVGSWTEFFKWADKELK